ncbi:MAG: ThuA domain-containing protein [Armatimonadetes bacterium]|nr:ThuA domain-containing protein [Armatimonadota bacterium]
MKKALIVRGGWDGHEPVQVADHFARILTDSGMSVEISDTLDAFKNEALMKDLSLIVPVWTMGNIEADQLNPLLDAVRGGCGIAGVHGGMSDAFRQQTEYQFMVGGQWVAHPGGAGVTYTVHIVDPWNPLTAGIGDFEVTSEKYYMHVDPGNIVLATVNFDYTVMPAVWIKSYGKGRVYYCSVGHVAADIEIPQVAELMRRGFIWAAGGEG